jgi:hypothetical protein
MNLKEFVKGLKFPYPQTGERDKRNDEKFNGYLKGPPLTERRINVAHNNQAKNDMNPP